MHSGAHSLDAVVSLSAANVKKDAGDNHFHNGRYANAVTCYTDALELAGPSCPAPDHAAFLANRAAAHLGLRAYPKAIEDSTASLYLRPGNHKALYRRGLAHKSLRNDRLAMLDFDSALRAVSECHPVPQSERLKFEGLRLELLEKLIGIKVEVAPVQRARLPPRKETRPLPKCLPPPPCDNSSIDAIVRLYAEPTTPLRARLIDTRRIWEQGTQAYHAKDYALAAQRWSEAMLVDDKCLNYNFNRMTHCVSQFPPDARGHPAFLRAHTQFLLGNHPEAFRLYTAILDDPSCLPVCHFTPQQCASVLHYRSMSRPTWDRPDKLADLEAAAELDPTHRSNLYVRALLGNAGETGEPARKRRRMLEQCATSLDPEDMHAAMVCYALAEHHYAERRALGKRWFRRAVDTDARVQRLWGGVVPDGPVPEDESRLPVRYCAFLLYSPADLYLENLVVDVRLRTVHEANERGKGRYEVEDRGKARYEVEDQRKEKGGVENRGKEKCEAEDWGKGKGKGKEVQRAREPVRKFEKENREPMMDKCGAEGCRITERMLREKERRMMLCGGCKEITYCSKECQRVHWKTHRNICNMSFIY